MMKRIIVGLASLLLWNVATAIEAVVDMTHVFHGGNQADDSASLQNAGHIYTLQSWLPFNQGDLIVANWKGNMSSLHQNAGPVTEMWVQIGPAWTTGEIPPEEVCDTDSDVPGCEPGAANSSQLFLGCHQPGCALWSFSFGAFNSDQYRIEQSYSSSGPWGLRATTSNTTYYLHRGSNNEYFRIRGENSYGNGTWTVFFSPGQCGGSGGGGGPIP